MHRRVAAWLPVKDRPPTRRRATQLLLSSVPLVLILGGCGADQSTLRPQSRPARQIARLFWQMTAGAALGLAIVVALLLLAWARRRRGTPDADGERVGWRVVVGLGIAVPIVVLATLFVLSDVVLIRDTQAPAASKTRLTVLVVGHQWFWRVRYPGTGAVTANEIHIPVRTPVDLLATSDDVIHSFWVPELNRKIDTIPGRTNRILLY